MLILSKLRLLTENLNNNTVAMLHCTKIIPFIMELTSKQFECLAVAGIAG